MRAILTIFALILPLNLLAKDEDAERDPPSEQQDIAPDPLTVRALGRLENKMEIQFKIPFPAQFDIDAYQKRPIALIPIDGSKVCATRPIVNPYDEPRKVEWMIGPEDPAQLLEHGFDCSVDLDERGEFSATNLLADWATDGTGNHQIWRGETESGADFFERARLTYQSRAEKAKDPAIAKLLLSAFEKIAITVQALRKEEAREIPKDVIK
jgi:hypothetical protein